MTGVAAAILLSAVLATADVAVLVAAAAVTGAATVLSFIHGLGLIKECKVANYSRKMKQILDKVSSFNHSFACVHQGVQSCQLFTQDKADPGQGQFY